MHSKLILFVIIGLVSGFFYLHTVNPFEITFSLYKDYVFTLPVTVIVFVGFIVGIVLMVFNSFIVDIKRAVSDFKERRKAKARVRFEKKFRQGSLALAKGDVKQAVKVLEDAYQSNVGDSELGKELVIKLAHACSEQDRSIRATELLETMMRKQGDDIELLFALVDVSTKSGEIARQERYLDEIIRLDGSNKRALSCLIEIKIVDRNFKSAINLQRTIISNILKPRKGGDPLVIAAENKRLVGLLFDAATVAYESGVQGEARGFSEQALAIDNEFIPAHFMLGDIDIKNGKIDEAIRRFEKAYKTTDSFFFLMRLEDIHLGRTAPDEALAMYAAARKDYPESVELRLLMARLHLRLEMVDVAIDDLEALAMEGHESFYRRVLLSEAYQRRNQTSKATELLRSAIALDSDLTPPFTCGECGFSRTEWFGSCPECKSWNSCTVSSLASNAHGTVSLASGAFGGSVAQQPAIVYGALGAGVKGKRGLG
jgi:lipopolysaccharide biosynthesis regulator YciM